MTGKKARRRNALARKLRSLRAAGWSVPALARRFSIARSSVVRLAPLGSGWRREPARLDDAGEGSAPTFAPAPALPPAAAPIETDLYPAPAPVPAARGPWPYHDAPAIGSENGRAKLDEGQVAELRALRAADPKRWTYPELARRFGIARSNVFYILSGRTWSHVPSGRR